jgi:hypothetical protein
LIKPKKEKQAPYKFENNFIKPKPPPPPVEEEPKPVEAPKKSGFLDALKGGLDTFRAFSHGVSQYVPVIKTADALSGRNEGLTPEQIGEKYSLQSYLGREPTATEKVAQGIGGFLPMLIGGSLAKTPLQMAGIGGGIGALGGYGGGSTPLDVLIGGAGGMAYVPGMHYATKGASALLGKVAPKLGNAGLQGLIKGVATDVGGAVGGTTASGLATAPFTGELLPSADEYKASILANVALNRAGSYLANRQMKGKQAPPVTPVEKPIVPPTTPSMETPIEPLAKITKLNEKISNKYTQKKPLITSEPTSKEIAKPEPEFLFPDREPMTQNERITEMILPKKLKGNTVDSPKLTGRLGLPEPKTNLPLQLPPSNLENRLTPVPNIMGTEPKIKIPEPIKLDPQILNESKQITQQLQPNLLENKTNTFADLQQKLDLLGRTKPELNVPPQNTVRTPLKTVDMKPNIQEGINRPLPKTEGIKREILSTKTNMGTIERVGDFVYKPTINKVGKETLEGEVYRTLKNVEGIAKGTTVKRNSKKEIKLPYYEKIISIDDVPKQERTNLASIIEPNIDRINKAVNELTNKNYNYSDPLQFGVTKDGKLELMDFSNVSKGDKYFDTKTDNYQRLAQFYKEFGLEKQAKIIDEGMRVKGLSDLYSLKDIANGDHLMPKEDIAIIKQLKTPSKISDAGKEVNLENLYYTTNEKIGKTGELNYQTEPIDGVKYIFTEKPIAETRLNELGLKKIYEAPISKTISKENNASDLQFMLKNASTKEKPKNRPLKGVTEGGALEKYLKEPITKKDPPKTELEGMLKGLAEKSPITKKGFENFTKSDMAKYKELTIKEKGQIEAKYSKKEPATKEEATNFMKQKQKEIKLAEKTIKEKIIDEINKRKPTDESKKKINDDGTVEERLEENIKFIKKEPPKPKYTYEKPELEESHQKYYGVKEESFLEKLKRRSIDLKKGFTNPIKEIERTEKNAEAIDTLVNMPTTKATAIDEANRSMEKIVKKLSFEDNNVLGRKIQLDDMLEDIKRELPLPHGFTPKDVKNELKRIQEHLTPEVKRGLNKYRATFNEAKEQYIKASEDLGISGMREILDREMYFRHMILTPEGARETNTSGGKSPVKISTNRSFLQERKGGAITNTNYLEPSFEVLWQMKNDTLLMKQLKRIEVDSIHEQVKQDAKIKKLKNWKDAIPEGYTDYQFKDDNFFFLTRSIPDEIAQLLTTENLKHLKIPSIDAFPEVLATGRKGGEWVIPKEVAIGLEKVGKQMQDIRNKDILSIIDKLYLKTTGEWKEIVLYKNPYNFLKYNIRNQTGDTDLLIRNRFNINNPVEATKTALKLTKKSAKEIIRAYKTGKFTKHLKEYYDMGGWQILSDITDVSQISKQKAFDFIAKEQKFNVLDTPKKFIDGYVTMVRDATQIREMVNRYTMYKDVLAELKANPNGLPNKYMSSDPATIKGLKTVERRAFKMANDVFLDYRYTSEYGKLMAKYIAPFWKFSETNARSTWQFVKNSMTKPEVAEKIGNKFGVVAPEIAKRLGQTLLRLSALGGMASAWNLLTQGDNIKDVPDDVKKRSYITLFKNALGETKYFSNIGSTTEVLEWFGLGSEPSDVEAVFRGDMSLKEYLSVMRIADKLMKAPEDVANKLVGMLNPIIKFVGEFPSGKKFFPDIFNPSNIKDRGQYLAEIVGLTDIYKYATGKPSKSGWDILNPMNLVTYKATAKKSAYDSTNNMVRKYLESIGKATKGYSENERSEALYYYKQAMKLKDKTAIDKYLKKYFQLGGTREGLQQSLKNLHPLAGMTTRERQMFMSKLTEKEKEKVNLAIEHYKDLMTPPEK